MIELPARKEEIFFLPEFPFPLGFFNDKLYLSLKGRAKNKSLIDRFCGRVEDGVKLLGRVMYEGDLSKELVDDNLAAMDNPLERHTDSRIFREFCERHKDLLRMACSKEKDISPLRKCEIINDFNQKRDLVEIIGLGGNAIELRPIILYFGMVTELIHLSDGKNRKSVLDFINKIGYRFLLLDDDKSINHGDNTTPGQDDTIIERIKQKTTRNLLAYLDLIKREGVALGTQKEIAGYFYCPTLDLVSGQDKKESLHIEKYYIPCGYSVDELQLSVYKSENIRYFSDDDLIEYKHLYQKTNDRFQSSIESGILLPADLFRFKRLKIITDDKVKDIFKTCIRKKVYNNPKKGAKPKYYAIAAIYLADDKSINIRETLNLSCSQFEELLRSGAIEEDKFIKAIRRGWIDKKTVIELIANGSISQVQAIESIQDTKELSKCDYSTKLLACSMGAYGVDKVEAHIANLPKGEEAEKPTDEILSKMVECIHRNVDTSGQARDYALLFGIVASSVALDRDSAIRLIKISKERGYITEEDVNSLIAAMNNYRIDQITNLVESTPLPNDKKYEGSINYRGLILDPQLRLAFLSFINDGSDNHKIGDLKYILINGGETIVTVKDPKTGKPKQEVKRGSFDGYMIILLPDAGVAVLEKPYKTKVVREGDSTKVVFEKKDGELVPNVDNDATYIIPIEAAVDYSKKFNKQQLTKSKSCYKVHHTIAWGEKVVFGIKELMKRRQNDKVLRTSQDRIDRAIRNGDMAIEIYNVDIKDNYNKLLHERARNLGE